MAVLPVIRFPDPALRKICEEIKVVDHKIKVLVQDMLETMEHYNGIGLSAIQVGHFVRLLVADTSSLLADDNPRYTDQNLDLKQELEKKTTQPLVIINPVITKKEGQVLFREGCLSFPSYYADVRRAATVEVEGLDSKGFPTKVLTDGVLSVCLQHEIDHLDGKLFIDHLSQIKAEKLRQDIKKYGYPLENSVKSP